MAPLHSIAEARERALDREVAEELIGPSALYFRAKFEAIERGQMVHWNWGVFLAGGMWFAYRRADRLGWGLNALYVALATLDTAGPILSVALWFASAALADYAYYLDIRRRLRAMQRLSDWQQDEFVATNSGAGLSYRVLLLLVATIAAYALQSPAIVLGF